MANDGGKTITIRNVSPRVLERLKTHAADEGLSLSALLLREAKRIAALPLAPKSRRDPRYRRLVAEGIVRPAKKRGRFRFSDVPSPRLPRGTTQQILDEEREDRF